MDSGGGEIISLLYEEILKSSWLNKKPLREEGTFGEISQKTFQHYLVLKIFSPNNSILHVLTESIAIGGLGWFDR